jgi:multiple sugar transport system permease protein
MSNAMPGKCAPDSFFVRNRKSGGYLLKKTVRQKTYSLIRALLLFGLCFMILQPILDKISISFMSESDLYDSTIVVIPRHLTQAHYQLASQLMLYGKALINTLWICLIVSVFQIAACTLTGYGFARFDFPLKRLWFACVVLVIIIPPQTISSSLYLHFRYFDIFGLISALNNGQKLNLRGSITPYLMMSLTCMGLKNGLYIYMIRQFFLSIPKSLEEAAYVDGCSTFKTFWRVILPDAMPILVSCFLFSFVWQWTDVFYSSLFLGGSTLLSMQISGLGERLSQYVSLTLGLPGGASVAYMQQIISTGTLMVIAPLIVLYIFAQRGFVQSISLTGIKM